MFRRRSTACLVLMTLVGLGVIAAIVLVAYVGLQQPEISQSGLEESPVSTPLIYTPPGLELTPGTGELPLTHAAPLLVRPQEEAIFHGSDSFEVTFVWTTDKDLDHDEEFYLQVWCRRDEELIRTEHWVKRTQLTMRWVDQMDCPDDRYFWSLRIYQIDGTTSSGERIGTPSSPPSLTRSFIWRSLRSQEG